MAVMASIATITRTCGTCRRQRPGSEFMLRVSETLSHDAGLCRDCRVKLWDDPDDYGEVERATRAPMPAEPGGGA
jgi:hypothetical protein